MRMTTTLLLFVLLLSSACSKIDSKLDELAAKPAATEIKGAKALYDETEKFVRWIEAKEKPTPEQLARAKALQDQRWKEFLNLGGNEVLSRISEVLGKIGIDIKNIDLSKWVDWFLGVNDLRKEKFGGPPREPTDPKGAEGWK